jgi:type I restriction enzyme S subunit
MTAAAKPPKDDEWKKRYNEPTPPDTSRLPKLPDGWQWASLDQLFRVERGRFSVRPRNDPRYFDGPYPFVQIGNLPREGGQIISYEQTLNEDGLFVSKLFSKGTVLIAIVGATIANTGILEFDGCCPDSLVGLQGQNGTLLELAEAYLRSKKLELRQASYSSGGQPNINLAMLLPYPMPLAPEAEQARIVQELQRRLSAIEAAEDTLQRQIRHASALRRAVLNDAFSGKLVAQDPNDEPASVLLERIRAERARAEEQKQKTPKAANGASRTNGQRRRRVKELAQGVSPGKG